MLKDGQVIMISEDLQWWSSWSLSSRKLMKWCLHVSICQLPEKPTQWAPALCMGFADSSDIPVNTRPVRALILPSHASLCLIPVRWKFLRHQLPSTPEVSTFFSNLFLEILLLFIFSSVTTSTCLSIHLTLCNFQCIACSTLMSK